MYFYGKPTVVWIPKSVSDRLALLHLGESMRDATPGSKAY